MVSFYGVEGERGDKIIRLLFVIDIRFSCDCSLINFNVYLLCSEFRVCSHWLMDIHEAFYAQL